MTIEFYLPELTEEPACRAAVERGDCLGSDFDNTHRRGEMTNENYRALAVCVVCPARRECLELALAVPTSQDFLIFGGTSRNARQRIRTARHREHQIVREFAAVNRRVREWHLRRSAA